MNVNSHGKSLQRCYFQKTNRVAQLEKEFAANNRNNAEKGLAGARDELKSPEK